MPLSSSTPSERHLSRPFSVPSLLNPAGNNVSASDCRHNGEGTDLSRNTARRLLPAPSIPIQRMSQCVPNPRTFSSTGPTSTMPQLGISKKFFDLSTSDTLGMGQGTNKVPTDNQAASNGQRDKDTILSLRQQLEYKTREADSNKVEFAHLLHCLQQRGIHITRETFAQNGGTTTRLCFRKWSPPHHLVRLPVLFHPMRQR